MMRRFTDKDLHEDPTLIPEAEDYARRYVGTFDFMLAAKRRVVDQHKGLTVPMARGVLNCMRMDPDEDVPEPQPIPMPDRFSISLTDSETGQEQEEVKRRRSHVRTPAKIRAPFGMANNGTVLHRTKARGYIDWTHGDWRNPPETGFPMTRVLHVYWAGHSGSYPKDPDLFMERPEGVPYCRSGCFTDLCPECGLRIHLPNDWEPNAKLFCSGCDLWFPQSLVKQLDDDDVLP